MKPGAALVLAAGAGFGAWWLWQNRPQLPDLNPFDYVDPALKAIDHAVGQTGEAIQSSGAGMVPDTPILQNDVGSLLEPAVQLFTGKPRGIRNNNPTNVETAPGQIWKGQTGLDGPYVVFDSPVNGIRAAFKIWRTYAGQGLRTPAQIAPHFSATAGIELSNYLRMITAASGLGPNDLLDTGDAQSMIDFAQGVIAAENGRQWADYYPPSVYQAAWSAI